MKELDKKRHDERKDFLFLEAVGIREKNNCDVLNF
jgi:hypothetical protein